MSRVTRMAPWEDFVLRLIAIYKFLHGLVFIAIGVGLTKLKHQDIPQFVRDYVVGPLDYIIGPMGFSPENRLVDWLLDEASTLTAHKLVLLSDAAFIYALLFCIEGVGLYLRKHWAEYFVVIVTGSLLPFEIWTLVLKVQWWKGILILGNLLILGYLVHRLRLDYINRRAVADSTGNGGSAKKADSVASSKR